MKTYEKYADSAVDWNQVAVDTPILVRNHIYEKWEKRFFAKCINGVVYTWNRGYLVPWKYAKLPKESEK